MSLNMSNILYEGEEKEIEIERERERETEREQELFFTLAEI